MILSMKVGLFMLVFGFFLGACAVKNFPWVYF
jgi:hypothetical protein